MSKTITVSELKETEAYKSDGKTFPHPNDLINQFIKIVSEKYPNVEDPHILVDKESGAYTEDGDDYITYGRGLVQCTLNIPMSDEMLPTIGLIWSYDTAKKLIKVFYGANVFACTNLIVSGTDDIYERQFKNVKGKTDKEKKKNWNRECEDVVDDITDELEKFVENASLKYAEYITMVNTLRATIIKGINNIHTIIGRLYLNSVILGSFDYSTFNEACRLIFNDKHLHKNKELYKLENNELSLWKMYGALTQRLSDGRVDIDMLPNKTLEVTKIVYDDELIQDVNNNYSDSYVRLKSHKFTKEEILSHNK